VSGTSLRGLRLAYYQIILLGEVWSFTLDMLTSDSLLFLANLVYNPLPRLLRIFEVLKVLDVYFVKHTFLAETPQS
jgi:hypothetical protein